MGEFAKKRVLVTGGASGIGLAQVKAFLEKGAEVFSVDKQLSKDSAKLRKEYGSAFNFKKLNVCQVAHIQKLQEEVPKVDILLNTAGILDDYAKLLDTSLSVWTEVLRTNVDSQFLITKAFLPEMLAKRCGVIINMASIAGLVAGGGGIAYTTSKHAVIGFTKQLALDCAGSGVRIYGISPGAIETPMNAKDFAGTAILARVVAQQIPLGRWGNPQEVADLTCFLASEKAAYLHGAIIPIDGGWLLR